MTRLSVALLWFGVFAAAVAGIGYWWSGNSRALSLEPDDRDMVAKGRSIYASHCAECHGANLEGQPKWRRRDEEGYLPAPPHDRTGHTWHHSDTLLFKMTKLGTASIAGPGYKTRMPGYQSILSDRDIIAVLSFIKSRWSEEIRRRHDRINEATRER